MKKIHILLLLTCITTASFSQVTKNFLFENLSRTYVVFTPTSYNANNPLPLVFVLHGFTQTASGIMDFSNFNAIAEANNFIAVYPNGTGFLQSWNSDIGASGVNDYGFLLALLDTMQANYAINTNRVYSCGFSNGGFMSHMLACQSNRFAAIASVGGTMTEATFNACNPSKKLPVLVIHGTNDAIVSYNGLAGTSKSVNDVVSFWNTKNNCPSTPSTTALLDITNDGTTVDSISYLPCANQTEVQLLKVNNGGHQWPSAIGNSGLGVTCTDINASQSIWNFFNKMSSPNGSSDVHELNAIRLLPNPVEDMLQILNSKEVVLINLHDITGKCILTTPFRNSISLQNIRTGHYILLLTNEKGKVLSSHKIFKR